MTAHDYHAFFVELVKNIRSAKTLEEFDAAWNQVKTQSSAFEQGVMTLFGQNLQTIQDPAIRDALVLLMTTIEWNQIIVMLMINPVALAGPELAQTLQELRAKAEENSDNEVEAEAEEEEEEEEEEPQASSPEVLAAIDKAFSKLNVK